MRHGPSGSARWAQGLASALAERPDIEIRGWLGPRRRRFRGPVRKMINASQDRFFYELQFPGAARRWAADVLLMPVNLTARMSRVPQVVTIHDANFLLAPRSYDRWYQAYASHMFVRAVRDAERVTTVSQYSNEQLQKWFDLPPEKATVVYPGLDPVPTNSQRLSVTRPYVLYVGATEPHKNLGVLLDAWSMLPPPPLRLVIAGRPGRDHEALAARASRFGLDVLFTGSVDQATLERWYAGASAFVFPSLAEGFGYPPLEAMARGIPVVASTAGALPEVLGDAALYHDPRDSDGLRRNIEHLLDDGALREQMAARGRARAARYTWAAAADGMMRVMRRAVGAVESSETAISDTWHQRRP